MLSTSDRYFASLTGAQRLLAFILVVALSTTLIAFLAGGWKTGIPVGILILAILWVTRPLWKPPSHDRGLRVQLTSLTVISSVALAVAGKMPEAKPVLRVLLEHIGLQHASAQQIATSDRLTSSLVLAFTLTGIFLVNWFTRDKSAMQKHPRPLDQDFPEQTYREQLRRYADILLNRLNTLDDETRWDDYFFAPLEAEVEILSGRRSTRKILDLMTALKADRSSRIILLLGDPGAGKSIALRKLAKELMKEVGKTGRLPVYVNLKEWGANRPWSEDSPPDAQELRAFILRTLKAYSVFADQFLGQYFDRMLDRGRFFFLLDSFDEIPAVLDVNEGSWLIQHLSSLITEFLVSQDLGRGIIASRFYRKPKFSRIESSTFEIRPFSDIGIHEALLRSEKLKGDTIDKLFRQRTELIPVARNPFSAALIRTYAESHGGALPTNQLEMYESYIRGRLDSSSEQIRHHGLEIPQVIEGATEIAWCMFREADIGLEAPMNQLVKLMPSLPVEPVTTVLRYSGLARMSPGTEPRFSFVHRRLNEYFVARSFLNEPTSITLQAIPTDSRYRDALALYCEVGELRHVKDIAAFCWTEIAAVGPDSAGSAAGQLRAVHCLRFLRDAFRTRPESIGFVRELANYIRERLQPGGDLLAAKIALEATGLLPEHSAEPILVKALQMGNAWISETALHACRHLKQIGAKLDQSLFTYLRSIPIREFLHRHREIVFSLSLSDAFRGLHRYCLLRSVDNRIFVAGIVMFVLTAPLAGIPFVLLWIVSGSMLHQNLRHGSFPRHFFRIRQLVLRGYCASMVIGLSLPVWIDPRRTPRPTSTGLSAALARLFPPSPLLNAGLAHFLLPGLRFAHGPRLGYIAAVYTLIGLALTPCLDLTFVFLRFPWCRLLTPKRLISTALIITFGLASSIAISRLLVVISPWCERHWLILLILFCSLILLATLPPSLRFLWHCYRDHGNLQEATRSTALTRATIAIDLSRFHTQWYRMRYIEWLRDAQVQPVGSWISARPNIANDMASTMLAQLDERWLTIEL